MNERMRELIAIIRDHAARLGAIAGSVDGALAEDIEKLGRTPRSALIIAGLLENYYTCLETVFVRISQFFENNLDPERWHTDLLRKMTLEIEGVRVAAVSRSNFPPLLEILKFRHFRRYYFDLEYDWDRLDFLVAELRKAHPVVVRDLGVFIEFLASI